MGLLIFYLILALVVSFMCSVMEAVLLTTPLSHLVVKAEQGNRVAPKLIKLKKDIDRPLAAILSLNTIAHTVGAAGVGAQATRVFGEAYFGIISAVLTIMILVFSEIIPKTIGARYWRQLSIASGQAIRATIFITYPLVLVAALFSRMFSNREADTTTSREEISALVNIGKEEGIFGPRENRIIQNIIRLKKIRITEIMTPRVVVAAADENMKMKDFPKHKTLLHFSRIPVYHGDFENFTGYIFRQGVFEELSRDHHNKQLKEIKRDVLVVPGTSPVFRVWEQLLERKEHMAIVVDDFGGMEGLVTMEDIIETMLGFEIVDETDVVTDMQQLARERWAERQEKYKYLDAFFKDKTTGEKRAESDENSE